MLSGGERALTAVALLMAMLQVRPVPFFLRSACSTRSMPHSTRPTWAASSFERSAGLAEEIQHVVITHNRGTIEAADALYGVTVGDDAVSRVISLKLADLPEGDPRYGGSGKR